MSIQNYKIVMVHSAGWHYNDNDKALGAPQLSLMDQSPLTMNAQAIVTNGASLTLLNGSSPLSQPEPIQIRTRHERSPSHTPSRSPSRALLRRTSILREDSPRNFSPTTDPAAADGENAPWVGAIGRASLGKSGRVIERLMADIDKMKRELNAEIQHREEIERRGGADRSTITALRTENENLQQAKEVDAAMLRRRDRMVDELKADLDGERNRRKMFEDSHREMTRQRDEAIIKGERDVSKAEDIAKHATSHADVLGQSHKQLSAEYRQRTETLAKDLRNLTNERNDERGKVQRLDVVVEQIAQELDRAGKVNERLTDLFASHKEESDRKLKDMQDELDGNEKSEKALLIEAERVVGEARWLIAIGKNAAGRQGAL